MTIDLFVDHIFQYCSNSFDHRDLNRVGNIIQTLYLSTQSGSFIISV